VPCAVLCEVTAERFLLRRRHWRTNRPQTAAVTAEPQLQVESPDSPRGKACENPQDLPSCTCRGSRAEEGKINKLERPHHDQAAQCHRAGIAHYRVRVVLTNALRHLASWTEPKIDQDLTTRVEGDWIDDDQYRDTMDLINWEANTSITRRWTE